MRITEICECGIITRRVTPGDSKMEITVRKPCKRCSEGRGRSPGEQLVGRGGKK